MQYTHRLVIGDWSDDGHNQKDFFTFKSNFSEEEIQNAYLRAVEHTKVSLHNDFQDDSDCHAILCDYEESKVYDEDWNRLVDGNVNMSVLEESTDYEDGGYWMSSKDVAILFLQMVKSQLEEFEYEIISEVKPINGYWHNTFNYGFGYGVFP